MNNEEQKTKKSIDPSDDHAFAIPAMTKEEILTKLMHEKKPEEHFPLEHTIKVVSPQKIEIHISYDYSEFEFIEENRDLNYDKANKFALLSMLENHNFFSSNPIIINDQIKKGKKKISDGQSRFLGSRLIDGPIYYIIDNNVTVENMSELNINQSNWTKFDYAKHFSSRQFSNYLYLMGLWKQYPEIDLHCLIDILKWSSKRSKINLEFKKGLFNVSEIERNTTEEFLQEIGKIYDFYERKYKKTFLISVMKLKKQRFYDHQGMIERAQKYQAKFKQNKLISKLMTYDILVEVHNMNRNKNRIKL